MICSRLLRCGGGLFAGLRGVLSPPGPRSCLAVFARAWFGLCSPCRLLSLVLCFASSRAWPPLFFCLVFLLCWCFCLRFCGCLFLGRRAPLCVWWGFFAFVFCLTVVGSPPLPVVASRPPCGWSLVASWPSSYAGPSLWVSGCFVTAWLPCLTAGGVVVLCRPHFILSHGSKGLWPCVGFVLPSTPWCMCCWGAQYSYAEVFIC